jgi:hypothetical protein
VDEVHSEQVRRFLQRSGLNSNPVCSRFAKWKRDAEYWHEKDSAMFVGLFNSVREKLVRSVVPHAANTTMADSKSVERHRPAKSRRDLD